MSYPIFNTRKDITFERILMAGSQSDREYRWIGRCKKCGQTHKVEGRVMQGYGRSDGGSPSAVIVENISGLVYIVTDGPSRVTVPCGDHWVVLRRVEEGTKASKHECGARCTNATGPNCDCRCRGKNHGSGC